MPQVRPKLPLLSINRCHSRLAPPSNYLHRLVRLQTPDREGHVRHRSPRSVRLGKGAPSASAVEKRVREARQRLKARPEAEIVVVTHGGFLHYFTEDWVRTFRSNSSLFNTEF